METRTDSKLDLLLRILRNPFVSILVLYVYLYYVNSPFFIFIATIIKGPLESLFVGAIACATLMLVYASFAHYVERRPISELALPGMGRELGIGLSLGFGLMTICVLIAMALGIYRIKGVAGWQNMLPTGVSLSLPVYEELVFRGVVFGILQRRFGSWVALILSSVAFGLVHLSNEGESVAGIASIVFVYGPMLAAPFMVTRRLWMSIGLHSAWNYTMGGIYSVNVSGNAAQGLLKATFEGPELLTGGSAGMEGSLIGMGVAVTFTVVMLVLAVRRGNIVPPPWKRTAPEPTPA